jgi:ABC-type multidrug transport system fused ATPase/permease subunit
MQSSLPYLEKIVTYMNLPIDLEKRMRLNRKRRTMGEANRKSAREEMIKASTSGHNVKGAFAADFVPLALKDVSFEYATPQHIWRRLLMKQGHKASLEASLAPEDLGSKDGRVTNCTFEFDQGLLIALVGVSEEGKSTLMKLFGAEIMPDLGDLLIPPHLRALHVSPQPIFFNDTLFYNLTYGVSKDNTEDGHIDRVIGICRRLKVSESLISNYLDRENKSKFEVKADWGDVLNLTQRVLLNLARAFIANPEVLVVHKPTSVFDDPTAQNTIDCLQEFVKQKGLLMNPKMISFRRPRTCIMTTTRPQGMQAANRIFKIQHEGVKELSYPISEQEMTHIRLEHKKPLPLLCV